MNNDRPYEGRSSGRPVPTNALLGLILMAFTVKCRQVPQPAFGYVSCLNGYLQKNN